MIMIKCSLFLVLFLSLCHSFLADQVQVHISSKNTENVNKFVHRILTSEFVKEGRNKKGNINTDIELDINKENKKDKETEKRVFQPLPMLKDSYLACIMCLSYVDELEEVIDRSLPVVYISLPFLHLVEVIKYKYQFYFYYFFTHDGLRAIQEILQNKKPLQICQDIHICRSGTLEEDPGHFIKNFFIGMTLSDECETCKILVKEYEKYLNSVLSVTFVLDRLSGICYVLQTKYQQACKEGYNNPIAIKILTEILKNEPPLKVCQDTGACPKRASSEKFNYFLPKVSYL